MISTYIKIAWRNLVKQPFYSILNTMGLAIGMAGALLIAIYIYDELSFDKMFKDADRIHRINADVKFGGEASEFSEVSAPMAKTILKDYPQVEEVTRFRNQGSFLVKDGPGAVNVKEEAVTYVDSTFFEMFGVQLIAGDQASVLTNPGTMVITRSAAEKHFPVSEAVGKTLILDDTDTYEIVGVIEDFPKNSFLRDHSILLAMAGYDDAQQDLWGSHNYPTFFKISPQADIDEFQESLKSMFGRYVVPWAQIIYPGVTEEQFLASGNYLRFSTIPLTDIHLHSRRFPEMSANGSIQNIYILSFIGIFLVILASVNFMNLSTARSLKRAKEVGIRKTLGSSKLALVGQFLVESILISSISLVIAIILAVVAMPAFNDLADKELSIPFANPLFLLALLLGGLILGLLSGIYPAFFMSGFNPVKVLKGSKGSDKGSGSIRNILVIFQFGISICLIVCTMVVFKQLKYIQNKDLGYEKDQVLLVEDAYGAGDQINAFRQEVLNLGQVNNVTLTSYLPTTSSRSSTSFFRDGARDQENALNMQIWQVDYDYLPTLDMELLSGRNFDRNYGTDSSAMILNESALEVLGITKEEALGIRLSSDLAAENPEYSTVVGVIKDFHFENMREEIGALGLRIGTSRSFLAVKIGTEDINSTISSISDIWNKFAPGQTFEYSFLDQEYEELYRTEQRLGKIFVVFTIISIFIACLGLFGLAALNTEKRKKEIGIRKVLGASVRQIFFQLTFDFLKLVFISIIIALPIAYLTMTQWLQDFSYKIDIGWGILLITAFLAILISVLTIGYQSIKAAITNPVKSLRTE